MPELPKKSLGQHWLTDEQALKAIAESAEISPSDTILEIGPGRGNLTRHLARQAAQVVAVELDAPLATALPKRVSAENLQVVQADILQFDLSNLPAGYKVVANIPYYLTGKLLRALSQAANPPSLMVLLVQKEVAERICATAGQMSLLAVGVQLFYDCQLGVKVTADKFNPAPKVDSQAVIARRRARPLFNGLNNKLFFQLVRAGFSEKRKKLRSALAGGLAISKQQADDLLAKAQIDGGRRAQELSLEEWHRIYQQYQIKNQ
ncbi:MAG TPA: 16S rRNA (adenine(1518)-N(6)/adenine(1519)-N(6))-dimethyltransferase RsmA [Candidatus Saccharimonadales bacterium]|nr:16S rRNA (adenine(1518)-N(6)/adenine(1519)-N(6))-dimethyltransferase RsmA [Candidatus Saccharimonadales bacterium]